MTAFCEWLDHLSDAVFFGAIVAFVALLDTVTFARRVRRV